MANNNSAVSGIKLDAGVCELWLLTYPAIFLPIGVSLNNAVLSTRDLISIGL